MRANGSGRGPAGLRAMVAAGLGLTLALAPSPAAAIMDSPTVTVEDSRTVGDVNGRFDVPVPLPVAWDVLTDYDHIADFVSSMRASAVESRMDGHLTVRQEAVVGAFPLRRTAHLLLRVREEPGNRIEFQDVLDRDFRVYRGEWQLHPGPSSTSVTYRLHAQPVRGIPPLIGRAAMRRTAEQLLTQVRAEMMRRAGLREAP